MTSHSKTSHSPVSVFPADALKQRLRKALTQLEADTSAMRDEWDPAFDSLAVVNIICCIDEITPGLDIAPEKIVQKGGYNSLERAVEHICAGAQRAWNKKN